MTLSEVRVNIDSVDRQIKDLFQQRMALAEQVALVKAQTGDDIFKPDRETAIIERLTADVDPQIRKEYTALIRKIMGVSRQYQYGRTLELRDCLNITWETADPDPERVAMKSSECNLRDRFWGSQIIFTDTDEEALNLAAEGSVPAGAGIMEYPGSGVNVEFQTMIAHRGLYVNRCCILQDGGKLQKAVLYSKHLIVRENHNRLKVMFVCSNQTGALAGILSMISDHNAAITEIHSRPFKDGVSWNYEFYLELEGCLLNEEIRALVFQMRSETIAFQILGSYECHEDF